MLPQNRSVAPKVKRYRSFHSRRGLESHAIARKAKYIRRKANIQLKVVALTIQDDSNGQDEKIVVLRDQLIFIPDFAVLPKMRCCKGKKQRNNVFERTKFVKAA